MARLHDLLFTLRVAIGCVEEAKRALAESRKKYSRAEADAVAAMRAAGLSAVHDVGDLWQIVEGRLSHMAVPDAYTVDVPPLPAGDPTDEGFGDDLAVTTVPVAAGRVS